MKKLKGIAPLVIILLVALGLAGGAAAGYEFREPIKKLVKGQTTAEEIKQAVEAEAAKLAAGKSKFELEGVATTVDTAAKIVTVKIKSSTNSIKELRLSETPVIITDTTKIISGSTENLKIADIPINSQVHVAGTIGKEGQLTGTRVVIQKDDASDSAKEATTFMVFGTVKSVASDSVTVTVAAANKSAKEQKGKDLEIKVAAATAIEKNHAAIALSDIKANDRVKVEGSFENSVYTASKIEVKVEEKATEIEETTTTSGSSSSNANGNANKNQNANSAQSGTRGASDNASANADKNKTNEDNDESD